MGDLNEALRAVESESSAVWRDFDAICACGGRFAGTESEKRAVALLKERLVADHGRPPEVFAIDYDDWQRRSQRLERLTPDPCALDCHALVWSPATPPGGLEAEVVDLGRGAPAEIAAKADIVRGRIVLVRHEYMFSAETVHRRAKYDAARAAGAVGFLIANRLPGNALVTGSSGRNGPDDIPAAGITYEGAALLRPVDGAFPRVRLAIEVGTGRSSAESLLLDLPGQTNELVALSAHIDGHPLGESALDNATGLAVVLAAARAVAPRVGEMRRGIRIALFNLEEWALAGSARYVDGLPRAARDRIALNVNLDSVAGHGRLTALTSDFPKVETFLSDVEKPAGTDLEYYRPLMRNSDHYNFARHGVPAFRLVAGFDAPDSALRHVLTPGDTRDKATPEALARAARLTVSILHAACTADSLQLRP